MQGDFLSLRHQLQGALPLVEHFLRRLGLQDLLARHIEHSPYRQALELLIKSVLLQPNALYRIEAWARAYDSSLHLGDDALGRALDRLFQSDRASLLTALIVGAVNAFGIEAQEIHNDSTSVKFCGAYEHQNKQAVQLRRGCSKDHRPDLKQLVYSLSVSADGALPIHFKAYAGNQADDPTHWETWQCLCRILDRVAFLYVADSKLCARETLLQIAQAGGHFLTIMPRTRSEWTAFAEQSAAQQTLWQPLWHRRALRQGQRRELFELAKGTYQSAEGFALHWYRSSEKRQRDAQERQQRVQAALQHLGQLNERRGSGPKTEAAVCRAAENILARYHVGDWVDCTIQLQPKVQFTQRTLRKPVRRVIRQRLLQPVPVVSARPNPTALAQAQTMDGTFPLVTNAPLSALEALQKYKYQPHLEKRHSLAKSVLQIAPVFLKNNDRIEALMLLYFIAQLVAALIERAVRRSMAQRGLRTIPILPEGRGSKTPSYAQVLDTFATRSKVDIYDHDLCIKTLVEPLTELQRLVLQLLGIDAAVYA
jgi:transposase